MTEIASLGLRVDGARNIDQASDSLDNFTRSSEKAETSTEGLASGSKKAASQVKSAGDASSRSTKNLNSLAGAAKLAAGALATVGVSLGLSQSIRQISEFQVAINGLAAVSNASASEMSALQSQARLLGATSMFSAQQAAEGQRFLSQAGFEVNETLSATPGILKLATAAQLDLSSAADIASNVLGGMRLEVDQLNRVNDVLAATAARSNTTIEQLGQALSFAAPFAASASISIEEASAAIGVMSDAGIQASRAGTGLVGVIRQLSNVTGAGEEVLSRYGLAISDVSIETRGLEPVLQTLREAGLNTADAIALFGSEAGAAAQVLVSDYKGAIEGATGEADRMAAQLNQGLRPAFLSLSSAASESVLQLGDSGMAGSLEDLVVSATGVISVWNGMGDTWADTNEIGEEALDTIEAIAGGIKITGTALAGAAGAYTLYTVAVRAATVAQGTFNLVASANPYVVLGLAIAGATAVLWSFNDAQDEAISLWERASESEAAYQSAISNISAANRIQEIATERLELQERLAEAQDRWTRNGTEEEHIKAKLLSLEKEYHAITDARIAAEKARAERKREADERELERKRLQEEADKRAADARERQAQQVAKAEKDAALEAAEAWNKSRESAYDSFQTLLDKIDPVGADLRALVSDIETVQDAVARGFIDEKKADEIVNILNSTFEEAGKKSAKAFENPWQSTADRVAQSLQDAIASGDWDSLGEGIGNALAASISGIVNKTITDSLAKDLTADSSALAQIGAAFAGPIAGAVAGGAIQLAMREVDDFFSLGDWDPTEALQASQGTGSVLGSIDAKSESISRAVQGSEQGIDQLVGINQGMLQALNSLRAGISGAAGLVQRGAGAVSLPGVSAGSLSGSDFSLTGGIMPVFDKTFGAAFDFLDKTQDFLTLGLVDLGDLLGGKSRQVDEGIDIIGGTISELIDETLVGAYATFRVKKNAWSSTKTREQTQLLGEEVSNQFSLVFEDIFDSILGAGALLGVDTESRLKDFEIATKRISLEGLDAGEQTAELEAVFSEIFDSAAGAAVPFVEEFQRAGEGLGETLARVANQVGVTGEVVDRLGLQFQELTGADLARASEYLARTTGGLENLIGGMQTFVSNFATEARQFELAESDLVRSLKKVNLQLPETRQGFYELLQAQDASTESGADAIAQILKVQGVAHGYYQSLEDGATEAARVAEEAAEQTKRLLGEIASALRSSTDNALSALQRSVSADMKAAQDQYDMRMQANQLATDAAQAGLQSIRSEAQAIRSATGQLAGSYNPIQSMLRATAIESVRVALRTGDLTGAGEAAQIAAAVNESGFATKEAFEVEQAKTLNLLSQLEKEGADQTTTAERALSALNDQADTIKRGFDQEQARLTDILANAQTQVDALRGIDNSTMAIADAINALSNALNLERPNAIAQAYSSAGRNLDSEGEAYWNQSIKSGSATTADLEFALWAANKENRDWFEAATGRPVPGYANGGMFGGGVRLVGERGPELEFTGSSRIMSNNDLMSSLGASTQMLNEMKAIHRDFMAGLDVIARNTNKSSKQLERWDLTGLPQERDIA